MAYLFLVSIQRLLMISDVVYCMDLDLDTWVCENRNIPKDLKQNSTYLIKYILYITDQRYLKSCLNHACKRYITAWSHILYME